MDLGKLLEQLDPEQISESVSIEEFANVEFPKFDVDTHSQSEEMVTDWYRHFLLWINGEENFKGGQG